MKNMKVVPLPVSPPPAPVPLRLAGVTFTGFAIMFLFFGMAGGWATLAPLESAAVAPGVSRWPAIASSSSTWRAASSPI